VINQLTLMNFKAFRQANIPLAPVTLLTGLNSSGKSTVLQSLALLRQSYEAGTLLPIEAGGARAEEGGGFLLDGELVELGTGRDVLHEDPFLSPPGTGSPTIAIGFTTSAASDGAYVWTASYDPERDVLPLGFQLGSTELSALPLFSRNFQYLKADRIVPATSYPRSHHHTVTRGFLGARGEHTVNFLRHHSEDKYVYHVAPGPLQHPEATTPALIDQVTAWMRELCPGVNLATAGIEGTDSVRLSFGFGSTGGIDSTRRRRPTNVGFGLTYALPIVVACLTATAESLILLENPEAHLHPRGQARMAALIAAAASTGAQIIVETHSDHVVDGTRLAVKQGRLKAEDALIHFFRGDGTGVEIVSPVLSPDGMLSEWPEGFFDETDNTLDQLLG